MTSLKDFSIFQQDNDPVTGKPGGGKILWDFKMSTTPKADLPIRAEDVEKFGHNVGRWRWANGPGTSDRIGYVGAYNVWQHEDKHPDGSGHDFTNGIRFSFQTCGADLQVNDRFLTEEPFGKGVGGVETQGLHPYPWELDAPTHIRRDRPGCVVEIFHFRMRPFPPNPDGTPRQGGPVKNQLLARITIPKVAPQNKDTLWFYQRGGEVLAVNKAHVTTKNPEGVIAVCRISSLAGSATPTT